MEWKEYRLIDLLDALIDYRGKTPKKTTSGVPLITAKIIKNGRIGEPNEFIAYEDYSSWMVRGFPEVGDVVVTTEAPLGEVAQLESKDIALAQRVVTLRGKKGALDNTYLKYFLLSHEGQQRLRARETGTTVTGIKQSELREVLIKCPPFIKQRRIAAILSSLDDKIENNNRINANLEAQAQVLFKSWFIDFEPFGGVMPDDWKEGTLGEIIDELPKSKIQVNAAKDIKGKFPFFTSGLAVYEYNEALVTGRNIFLNTGGVAGVEFYVGNAAYSTDTWCIKGKDNLSDYIYLYLSLMIDKINAEYFEGSALKHLQKKPLKDRMIIIPNAEIIDKFNKVVVPLFDSVVKRKSENKSLGCLRDTLLPKLMKGEIAL